MRGGCKFINIISLEVEKEKSFPGGDLLESNEWFGVGFSWNIVCSTQWLFFVPFNILILILLFLMFHCITTNMDTEVPMSRFSLLIFHFSLCSFSTWWPTMMCMACDGLAFVCHGSQEYGMKLAALKAWILRSFTHFSHSHIEDGGQWTKGADNYNPIISSLVTPFTLSLFA